MRGGAKIVYIPENAITCQFLFIKANETVCFTMYSESGG